MASVGLIPIRDGKSELIVVVHHHISTLQAWLFLELFALLLIHAINRVCLIGIIIYIEDFINLHPVILLLLEEGLLLAAHSQRQADVDDVDNHKIQEREKHLLLGRKSAHYNGRNVDDKSLMPNAEE